MIRKALVRDSDNLVVNIVSLPDDWTGKEDEWPVPADHFVVDAGAGAPGDTWNGTLFIKPPALPVLLPAMNVEDIWEVLRTKGVVVDADVPAGRRQPPAAEETITP